MTAESTDAPGSESLAEGASHQGGRAAGRFVVGRNPDPESSLPYLLYLPLGGGGIVLKARETWPRTTKVFCHRTEGWPAEVEVVESVAVRSCVRRGAAIDLVLDRERESRSQIVFARRRDGRDVIFWQTARTAKKARPNVGIPAARDRSAPLTILVDTREHYPWRFQHQAATTEQRALAAGDYGVELAGEVVAAVERKTLPELATVLTTGALRSQLAGLAGLPRAAVVVEDRYSGIFKLRHVRPAVVADALAEEQARFPNVPIVFCETRPLAQDWAYRFLGACLAEVANDQPGALAVAQLAWAEHPEIEPSTAEVRAWALASGLAVSDRGRLKPEVWAAYRARESRSDDDTP